MNIRDLISIRFRPSKDLAAVAASWLLVTGSLWTATFVVGPENGGGYFLVYAVVTALLAGIALPTWWMVWHRGRRLADLGVTTRLLGTSLVAQLVFSALQYTQTFARMRAPAVEEFLPLVALSLCVGFFEAVFWRGWVQQRLEEAFGFVPALLAGAALYAVYHVGYGMPWSEISFLFVIGLVYGAVFRLTKSVFVLWPLLQPMGQLTTLVRDGLSLPPIAVVGFGEVLLAMLALLYFAHRRQRKAAARQAALSPAAA